MILLESVLMSITIVELIMRLAAAVLAGQRDRLRARASRAAGRAAYAPAGIAGLGDVHARFGAVPFSAELSRHRRDEGFLRADVGRIASNVVVGIGFLGGGAILRSGFRVEGLTTAASLWLVAAVGMASGAGLYVLAFATAAFALVGLVGLHFVEVGFKSVLKLRVRIDTVGEFLSRAQLQDGPGPLGASVKDVDYCPRSGSQSLANSR